MDTIQRTTNTLVVVFHVVCHINFSFFVQACSMFLIVYAISFPQDEGLSHSLSVLGTIMYDVFLYEVISSSLCLFSFKGNLSKECYGIK